MPDARPPAARKKPAAAHTKATAPTHTGALDPIVHEAEHGLVALLQRRPTETVSGLALAASVYGFLTQAGLASVAAALIAVAIAFVPGAVSATVDHLRK